MSLEPIFTASLAIQLHVFVALIAVLLGGINLVMKKGTRLHKIIGYAWVLCMSATSISSFWIFEIKLWGNYSPIHLLSVFTLALLVFAIHKARTGKIRTHQYTMMGLYFFALLLTGALAFLPGRIMHAVLMGG